MDALVYLSNNQIVHGSIQPSSIFCNNIDDVLHAKLGNMMTSHATDTPLPRSVDIQKIVDKRSLAPEILDEELTTEKSDVWSYGILLWVSQHREKIL